MLEYSSFQIYQAGDASICELYFSVYNSVVSFLILYICSQYLLCVEASKFLYSFFFFFIELLIKYFCQTICQFPNGIFFGLKLQRKKIKV